MSGHLVVHTAREVIEIPLTGDAKIDAPPVQTSALDDHGDAWEPVA